MKTVFKSLAKSGFILHELTAAASIQIFLI